MYTMRFARGMPRRTDSTPVIWPATVTGSPGQALDECMTTRIRWNYTNDEKLCRIGHLPEYQYPRIRPRNWVRTWKVNYQNLMGRYWWLTTRTTTTTTTCKIRRKYETNRPRIRSIDTINEDIESTGLILRGAIDFTKDRGRWKSFIRTHRSQMAGVKNLWWERDWPIVTFAWAYLKFKSVVLTIKPFRERNFRSTCMLVTT